MDPEIFKKNMIFHSVLTLMDPVSEPIKTPTENKKKNTIFISDLIVSFKMDHFDILFACSIFPRTRELTNRGFLDMAHLPVSVSPGSVGEENSKGRRDIWPHDEGTGAAERRRGGERDGGLARKGDPR